MTAIAYKGGLMAADTATFDGDAIPYHIKKIWRVRGSLVASAGQSSACMAFRDWYATGKDVPFERHTDDFDGLVVQADGVVLRMSGQYGQFLRYDAPFHAIGAGTEMLIGAMAAGATAPQAVEIAIKWSRYAGGGVQVETLEDRSLQGVIGGPAMLDAA